MISKTSKSAGQRSLFYQVNIWDKFDHTHLVAAICHGYFCGAFVAVCATTVLTNPTEQIRSNEGHANRICWTAKGDKSQRNEIYFVIAAAKVGHYRVHRKETNEPQSSDKWRRQLGFHQFWPAAGGCLPKDK